MSLPLPDPGERLSSCSRAGYSTKVDSAMALYSA